MLSRVVFAGTLAGVVIACGTEAARADEGAANAAAEALFQEGRALLMAGKAAEACPKLEESHRLDPATGTLMALALCREQQGKLASAWAAFVETEGRSRLDGRGDRERLAHEHATTLRPRLSTLNLRVPPELAAHPALTISLDGVALGHGAWNVDIPVDGGAHAVEARISAGRAWSATVTVGVEGQHARLDVRSPGELGAAEPSRSPSSASPSHLAADSTSATDSSRVPGPGGDGRAAAAEGATVIAPLPALAATQPAPGRTQRIAGVVVASAGALAVGTALFVALDAKHDYDRSIADCSDKVCGPSEYDQIGDARHRGNLATGVAVIGGAAVVAGAVLWLLAPSGPAPASGAARGPRIERVGLTGSGAAVAGRFW